MAHKAQRQFCLQIKQRFPALFTQRKVLDIGSYDINGNNRFLFEDCDYTGIDINNGPNVDIVTKAHEYTAADGSYDVVISTEALEHDIFYQLTLARMYELLKPDGLLLLTCATTGRKEHGTRNACPGDSPATAELDGEWGEYYKNLTEHDIRPVLAPDENFSRYEFIVNKGLYDLYFWGIKAATP